MKYIRRQFKFELNIVIFFFFIHSDVGKHKPKVKDTFVWFINISFNKIPVSYL